MIIVSVEELVQAFEHSDKKAIDIRNLSNKFNITEREVIDVLNQFNIKAPKIVSRSEVIDIDKNLYGDNKINEIENKIELDDSDISPTISIIRKFEDMGFAKKEGVERAIQLSYYIETKLGLDCFKIYCSMLEFLIKNSGVEKLEQDLASIQNGARFNVSNDPEARIMETYMEVTNIFLKDLLKELDEPEPEPKKVIDEKPFLARVYEAYNMLTNPEQYRFEQMRKKEAEKKDFFKKGVKIFRDVLDND
ncbi:hypothetical protein ES705_32257 [subsurface metagenome]